jgi:hypothetical protein
MDESNTSPVRRPDGVDRIEAHGWREEYEYLRICGTCFHLFETHRPDGLNQQCSCAAEPARTWAGFDINEHASLCKCCGFDVLDSGSKWSPFFCRECQLVAMGASISARRLIVPIGRHSLMHTWVPRTPASTLAAHGGDADALAHTVFKTMTSVADLSDRLDDWYRVAMARNFERLGVSGGVLVRDYLDAVVREGIGVLTTRLAAFDGLCELLKHPSVERPAEPNPDPAPPKRTHRRPPATIRDLVYGQDSANRLVFIPKRHANYLARVWHALYNAKTWVDLKRLVPPAEYRWLRERNDALPPSDLRPNARFDYLTMTAAADGDYPGWPAQEMLEWMPEDVQADFGVVQDSVHNGSFLELQGDAKPIANRLRAFGFRCRRDDRLVLRASGGD